MLPIWVTTPLEYPSYTKLDNRDTNSGIAGVAAVPGRSVPNPANPLNFLRKMRSFRVGPTQVVTSVQTHVGVHVMFIKSINK